MSSMNELEREIEESRARLDQTIDRIQGRLSAPNIVDEMLGNARRVPQIADAYDGALDAVRRNPVPVLLIAAGVGMLFNRMAREAERRRTQVSATRVASLDVGAPRRPGLAPEARPDVPGAAHGVAHGGAHGGTYGDDRAAERAPAARVPPGGRAV